MRSAASTNGDEDHSPAQPLRILVADDDRDSAATLALLLTEEGHQVREVYRGDAVLRFVREFAPDVVLLDIGMPGMSGYDVARQLKAEYGDNAPLMIAVTAWTKGADRILGKIVGFDDYVTKPYDATTLISLVVALSAAKRSQASDDKDAFMPR